MTPDTASGTALRRRVIHLQGRVESFRKSAKRAKQSRDKWKARALAAEKGPGRAVVRERDVLRRENEWLKLRILTLHATVSPAKTERPELLSQPQGARIQAGYEAR